MKKAFMSATIAVFTLVLTLSSGIMASQAAETKTEKGQKANERTTEKDAGEKLIQTGKQVLEEGKKANDATMIKNGQLMIQQGQMMKDGTMGAKDNKK
ncbi:MAG: hypothetical protein M0009_14475 [Deltaproteobacteria bacterium]|nr:hypothetical protein [Deltaproteobacteria bacterium]